ncbi:class I adenylate-forming enzyme family protein [Glutamicibacter arilaitensis]|uniref:class I adenylate-forming enzyme family protein n=1 Tax=Glutamicibacter arilaitensis TaxID=256701 RepID=UPI00384B1E3D
MNLASQLHQHALTRPDHPAVISSSQVIDYATLYASSHDLAQLLQTDPSIGRRIGLYCSDPVALAIGFHACLLAGVSAMILDPSWPAEKLRNTLTQFGSPKVLTDQLGEASMAAVGHTALPVRPNSERAEAVPLLASQSGSESELLLIFTSGSTGSPKAVVRTRGSWEQSINHSAAILGASKDSKTLVPGPLAHGLGLYAMVESVALGGTLVAPGRWRADKVRPLLQTTSCNRLVAVPALVRLLMQQIPLQLLSGLRHVVTGGEALSLELAQQVLGLSNDMTCTEYFGSSEHSLIAYRRRSIEETGESPFTGTLFAGVQAHLHAQNPTDGTGRLMIRSAFNATGYDPLGSGQLERCEEATGIGDIARLIPGDRIQILGRGGDMMNINGNNVYPAEISTALEAAGLMQPLVQAHLIASGRTLLTAYVLHPQQQPLPDPLTLLEALREVLPIYKIPHELVFLSSWPLLDSGKRDIRNLPAPPSTGLRKLRLR